MTNEFSHDAAGYAPNTNLTAANDSANGNWTFAYDDFNRLASAAKTGTGTYTYQYDRYGNRWNQLLNGTGQNISFVQANNQVAAGNGVSYDAAGNVLNDGFHSYTYDAENRLLTVDGSTPYVYDANGRRIKTPTYEALYDLAGHVITQSDPTTGTWNYGEIYAGGMHLATYSGSTTNFLHADWLGTKRVMTGMSGAISESCSSLPFGDGQSCTGPNWGYNSFTDDPHDFESNLEHTWFRQLSTTEGRWLSPDPYDGSMDIGNPQSFNRYAYVLNNPTNLVDPLGLRTVCTTTVVEGQTTTNCADDGIDITVNVNVPYAVPFGGDGVTTSIWGYMTPTDALRRWLALKAFFASRIHPPAKDTLKQQKPKPCSGTKGGTPLAYSLTGVFDALVGAGPALSISYVPGTQEIFIAPGVGASLGHNLSGGPLIGPNPSAVLPGWGLSTGYNVTPLTGVQAAGNRSGTLAGNAFGVPGASIALTYGFCISF